MTVSFNTGIERGTHAKKEEKKSMISNWYRKCLVAVPATLCVVACGLLGAGTGTASAGSNGQHVIVEGTKQYKVQICGWNQSESYGCTPVFATPTHDTPDPNKWWWVSKDNNHPVSFYGWDKSGNTLGWSPKKCFPPKEQADDWTTCPTGW
jgi:hypothetical protein